MKKNLKGVVLGVTVMSMMASMLMPLGSLGVTVNAAETETTAAELTTNVAQGKCGDTAEYKYNEDTATLTITGTGEMWDDSGFAKAYYGASNIVIEEGITTIGSYSFEGLYNVTSVTIPNSVTTIKKNAFEEIYGTVEIPASVTKVEENAFEGATKFVFKGNISGYETNALGIYGSTNVDEIVVHSEAQDLGKAVYSVNLNTITIARENTKCKITNGSLLSSDGKILYYCISPREDVVIPDTVETICTAAFANKDKLDSVKIGKNVKKIGDFAFEDTRIGKITFNKKALEIGVKAFAGSKLKTVEFKKKVKLNVGAFDRTTKIKNAKFKNSQTTITKASINKSKYNIRYSKVSGATGYQIVVKKGKKTYKYTTTKTTYTGKVPSKVKKDYSIEKGYSLEDDQYLENPKGAATVTVRPYKVVKKKKVYAKTSTKMVLNYKN